MADAILRYVSCAQNTMRTVNAHSHRSDWTQLVQFCRGGVNGPLRCANCIFGTLCRFGALAFARVATKTTLRRVLCCITRVATQSVLSSERKTVKITRRLLVPKLFISDRIMSEVFTFCVSRRRRKMYCGHARLCVCLSVCLSVCPRPHGYTIARTRM